MQVKLGEFSKFKNHTKSTAISKCIIQIWNMKYDIPAYQYMLIWNNSTHGLGNFTSFLAVLLRDNNNTWYTLVSLSRFWGEHIKSKQYLFNYLLVPCKSGWATVILGRLTRNLKTINEPKYWARQLKHIVISYLTTDI